MLNLRHKLERISEFFDEARIARDRYGLSVPRQVGEALLFSRVGQWAHVLDYHSAGFFQPGIPLREKRRFIGRAGQRALDRALNDPASRVLANDKLIFYGLMDAIGVARPRIFAVYERFGRRFRDAATLTTRQELRDYLVDGVRYPLFAKPVWGLVGRGAFGITGFDTRTDRVLLTSGEELAFDRLAETFDELPKRGILFQELLRPHRELRPIVGDRLSALRIVLVAIEGRFRVFTAFWRIATGKNMTDNFHQGRSTNLLAAVDVDTGRVLRAIGGAGSRTVDVARHPDTGAALRSVVLPDWRDALELCFAGALSLPGLRLQHWDVALTDDGPVALEVNIQGGMTPSQLLRRRAVLDATIERAVADAKAERAVLWT